MYVIVIAGSVVAYVRFVRTRYDFIETSAGWFSVTFKAPVTSTDVCTEPGWGTAWFLAT
jgi:hypothetical protein